MKSPTIILELMATLWESLEIIPELWDTLMQEKWSQYAKQHDQLDTIRKAATLLTGLCIAAEARLAKQIAEQTEHCEHGAN